MRRSDWLVLAAMLGAGLLVALVVALRVARPADAWDVIAVPPAGAVQAYRIPDEGLELALPDAPEPGEGSVTIPVATYGERARTTVRMQVRDPAGSPLEECSWRPSQYGDNALLRCQVPDLARARTVQMTLDDPSAPVAAYAVPPGETGGLPVAGQLERRLPTGALDRVERAVERLGVTDPRPYGGWLALLGLAVSLGLSGFAAWLVLVRASD